MRRSSILVSAALMISAVSGPVFPYGSSTYESEYRARRLRRKNQSPSAQRARRIRTKKRNHAKRYNRHFTPKMSTK